ncbi:hypothetical protein BU16DRAFT_509404 [Lophium mytilinum]|uniref:DUF6594 domain-containing protein n=1 Tax=Lophium mytilinum TaxID=390894 RepID=A0A6A6QW03_9PEZI|nr:hypothetical protein BU16DRAFT_509404 [Lophium mytilinum]
MSMSTSDIELSRRKSYYLNGYPSLAHFIASDRDKSTVVFRRFDRLSARNLLCLQSELAELEAKQDAADQADALGDIATKQNARNWEQVRQRAKDGGREIERVQLAIEIREKLKEYREALMFESTLLSLAPPSQRVLQALRIKFQNITPDDPEGWPTLGGASSNIYDDGNDLVALRTAPHQDRMTTFVRDRLGIFFTARCRSDPIIQDRPADGLTAYVSETKVTIFVTILSTIMSAILLVGAIVSLYIVTSQKARLGMIGGFTVLFAVTLVLLTNARRAEVFGASAA